MRIRIKKEIRGYRREELLLGRLARALSRKLINSRAPGAAALKRAELSLVLTNDKKIRAVNRDWRRKDKATDVLSFPQYGVAELKALAHAGGLDGDFWSVGDIVISLERAEAQAREKGISLRRELEVLFIHGFLHLLGYDHEGSEREAQRMHRLERKLLGP